MALAPIDPTKTAIVLVDMINHQLTPGVGMLRDWEAQGRPFDYMLERVQGLMIPAYRRLLPAARAAGAKVVYLRVGAAASDYADAVPSLKEAFRRWEAYDGSWGCQVIEALAPQPGDLSIMKASSGAFASSALDPLLRNMGIEHVAYTGVVTNGCVLLTLTGGYDHGYKGYLLADATATWSQHLQDTTEEIVGLYMAKVADTDAFMDAMGCGAPALKSA